MNIYDRILSDQYITSTKWFAFVSSKIAATQAKNIIVANELNHMTT